MRTCPSCARAFPETAAECPFCGLILAKWEKRGPVPPHAAKPDLALGTRVPPQSTALPAALATIIAAYCTWRFRSYLPIPQGWEDIREWLYPLSALIVVFHEAGHWIFGVLGMDFLTVAGGTLMQLLMPGSFVYYFLSRKRTGSAIAILFWIGMNFIDIAYYAADAKMQVIILITGVSGSEGGMHDWGYMLDRLGLTNSCVGIGQMFFFIGCWLMALPILWGLQRLIWKRKRLVSQDSARVTGTAAV